MKVSPGKEHGTIMIGWDFPSSDFNPDGGVDPESCGGRVDTLTKSSSSNEKRRAKQLLER